MQVFPDTQTPVYRAAELATLLGRFYPNAPHNLVARIVTQMQAATRAAKSWETRRCNYTMSESQAAKGEYTIRRTMDILNTTLSFASLHPDSPKHPNPAKLDLGGDCRGSCGQLYIPGTRGDRDRNGGT